MWICAILLNLDKVINPQVFIYYPLRLSSTGLLYWISYQGFYNYSLMAERIQLRKEMDKEEKLTNNFHNTKEPEDDNGYANFTRIKS